MFAAVRRACVSWSNAELRVDRLVADLRRQFARAELATTHICANALSARGDIRRIGSEELDHGRRARRIMIATLLPGWKPLFLG